VLACSCGSNFSKGKRTGSRWGNLWPAIVIHAGFDLLWMIFQLGDNGMGDLVANAARLAALAIAIAGTLVFTRRQPLA
jgi:hypothetical protein